ncbi:MAG: Nudix family hydrolase [Zoogloeaceae bacterium]|nr:Nudix family hydrolase [Zoogloeaceae bacterium]
MTKRVEVAAGVIVRGDGAFLLGRRAPGTFYPGYWEFPGGKVEPGEDAAAALIRELDEELGIRARALEPWIVRRHDYEHACVTLRFFRVTRWEGEINDLVHDALSWQSAGTCEVGPMLPANGPVMKALRLPEFMGITHALEIDVDEQLRRLEAALAGGLRLVQIRESGMPQDALLNFTREVVARAREYAAIVVVNGDAATAHEAGADGIHLKSSALAGTTSRPEFEWVGASCHDRAELERVAALGLDYALLGPVRPTLTHPGAAGMGWERFAELTQDLPMPVLGLGGLSQADVAAAREHGGHGVASIRSAWPR